MDQTEKAKRYPTVPAHALPRSRYKTATANGLTRAIIQWLTLNGCYAVRVSSAGRYLPSSKKFIPSTTRRGTADIHAVIGGRHVSIEVKIGRDRMSEAQEKAKTEIERAGGLFLVARDFDSFIEWYNTIKN
jgi:Holliday junction resolvase